MATCKHNVLALGSNQLHFLYPNIPLTKLQVFQYNPRTYDLSRTLLEATCYHGYTVYLQSKI